MLTEKAVRYEEKYALWETQGASGRLKEAQEGQGGSRRLREAQEGSKMLR